MRQRAFSAKRLVAKRSRGFRGRIGRPPGCLPERGRVRGLGAWRASAERAFQATGAFLLPHVRPSSSSQGFDSWSLACVVLDDRVWTEFAAPIIWQQMVPLCATGGSGSPPSHKMETHHVGNLKSEQRFANPDSQLRSCGCLIRVSPWRLARRFPTYVPMRIGAETFNVTAVSRCCVSQCIWVTFS